VLPRIPRPPLPTARIAGQLHVPVDDFDYDIQVAVRPSGSERWDTKGEATDGTFVVRGLIPGQRYEVEFSGTRLRTLRLIGIVAPAADLDVRLEPRAVISVAVGFPRGEACPISRMMVRAVGADEWAIDLAIYRPDCRFELPAPVSSGLVTVAAEGDGARLETAVLIPDQGDPAPICLSPPCRADPLEGQARLHVLLDGGAGSPIEATVVPVGDADARYFCASSIETCSIEALPPGHPFSITASGRDCRGGPVIVTVAEGDNTVSVPCISAPAPIASVPDPPPIDLDL